MKAQRPLIFNIHHFALDDGPGIRTTVFFKGCPLKCVWCHNPESMSCRQEISFYPDLCIQCGECEGACKEGAVDISSSKRILRDRCSRCGKCADICPATALKVAGRYYAVDELADILLRDRIFYETSGGGVTFSGGEPTMHTDYLSAVMQRLKKENIHIAVQTSGMFNLYDFRTKLLANIDLIYYDLKIIDPELHKYYTETGNKRLLNNFVELAKEACDKIVPRIPLIPKITATRDNLSQIAAFLKNAGSATYELLPYNSGGIEKRHSIGKVLPAEMKDINLDIEEENECREIFSRHFREQPITVPELQSAAHLITGTKI